MWKLQRDDHAQPQNDQYVQKLKSLSASPHEVEWADDASTTDDPNVSFLKRASSIFTIPHYDDNNLAQQQQSSTTRVQNSSSSKRAKSSYAVPPPDTNNLKSSEDEGIISENNPKGREHEKESSKSLHVRSTWSFLQSCNY